jgi:hypothetical protein
MMEQNYMNSRDDGVSESIGFILIFTIVIMGIGLVTLYGYPMLLQQQTGADEQIMEKNMIVLQNDFKSLAYKTVPYKETSMKIGGGSLTVNNAMSEAITGPFFAVSTASDCGSGTYLWEPTGDLTYQSTQSQVDISLQNGAIVKRNFMEPGSTMLAQPRWFYNERPPQTMVINIVTVNSSSIISKEGIGSIQMELGQPPEYPTDYNSYPISAPLYVCYIPDTEQDYSIAWDGYFKNTLGLSLVSGTPGTGSLISYQLPQTSTLVIKRTDINIRSL